MAGTERKLYQWENQVSHMKREFRVEGELTLNPESPPIERIVYHELRIADLRTEESAEGLTVQGRIVPQIVYSGFNMDRDEDQKPVYHSETDFGALPFSYRMEIGAWPSNVRWEAVCAIVRGTVERQLHQSVRIEVELSVALMVWEKERMDLIGDSRLQSANQLQTMKEPVATEIYQGKFTGATQTQASFDLPYAKAPLARILTIQARPFGLHWEIQTNRIHLEGNLGINVTYISSEDDGREGPVEMAEWGRENPLFWQMDIDAPKADEGCILVPRVTVMDPKAALRGSEGIRFEAGIQAEVAVYKPVQDEVLVDIRSQDGILDLDRRSVNMMHTVDNRVVPMEIEQLIDLPAGMPDIGRIVSYHIGAGAIHGECAVGKFILEGAFSLNLTYAAADEERYPGLYTAALTEPGTAIAWGESLEAPDVDEGMLAEVDGVIHGGSVEAVDGRKIRMQTEAVFKVKALEVKPLSVVADWAEVPSVLSAPRPSMVFYLTQPGDTLWKVARKYQTTMEALARENHLAPGEALQINRRMIIPTVSSGKVTVLK